MGRFPCHNRLHFSPSSVLTVLIVVFPGAVYASFYRYAVSQPARPGSRLMLSSNGPNRFSSSSSLPACLHLYITKDKMHYFHKTNLSQTLCRTEITPRAEALAASGTTQGISLPSPLHADDIAAAATATAPASAPPHFTSK